MLGPRGAHAQPRTPTPRPTPGISFKDTPILGPLPDCTGRTELLASSRVVRVNEPVTLTCEPWCPASSSWTPRAVVLVLGGLPDGGGLIDARRALRRIVGAFAARDRNRLALVDVAAPEAPRIGRRRAPPDALTARRSGRGARRTDGGGTAGGAGDGAGQGWRRSTSSTGRS
ncbi:MAG: hypothetical protein U0470_02905 [Anaerolineae bacterium]